MSYANPDRRVYVFPLFDYGGSAGARTDSIVGPKGKSGTLIDYGVQSIQENFAGTTSATIAAGTLADPDAYGDEFALNGGTTATGGRTVQDLYDPIADKTSFDALMLVKHIPKDTVFTLTNVEAATGPTGQASPYCVIDWAD